MPITTVTEDDLEKLLPLMRSYCDFYACGPSDADLIALSRALIADPEREGVQFLATTAEGWPTGFATLFWSWDTTVGGRIGVMNDLFVTPAARGAGVADALVLACAQRSRARDATRLTWVTAPDNHRARGVYDRLGGVREEWITYHLEISPSVS